MTHIKQPIVQLTQEQIAKLEKLKQEIAERRSWYVTWGVKKP